MARVALKVFFFSVNLLYVICGVLLAFGGCWYSLKLKEVTDLRNYDKYQLDDDWHLPQVMPWAFCCIGVFAVIISLAGVSGAAVNSKSLLVIHAVFLTMAVLLLAAAAVITMVCVIGENKVFISETIRDAFNEARKREDVRKQFGEIVEQGLHCCGSDSYLNYVNIHQGGIPKSCCRDGDTSCYNALAVDYNSRRGCLEVATRYTRKGFLYATAACAATGLFGILSLILNVVLTLSLRSRGKEVS